MNSKPLVNLCLSEFDKKFYEQGYKTVAGIDEAGRGPLAGPVVAAACVIPPGMNIPGIDDSKKLSPKKRALLFTYLTTCLEIDFSIGIIEAATIDEINILQATLEAMSVAIKGLKTEPDCLLVDGLHCPKLTITNEAIVKGDQKSQSIAAASIIAKVTRDQIMQEYHQEYPGYGFGAHKGYGTKAHLEAIKQLGPISIHRKSFEPIKSLKPF
ncbi:MAG: ribonuclease HII [Simkaniaceae bacterium]|nr:ribonuclease HII [Simkaniaceae bacterium]